MILSEHDFHVSKKIKYQFEKAKSKVIEGDQDRVYIITGREGLGKSTLALQFAYLFDSTFCIEDIVFNADEFEKRIREVPKNKAIVFDECFNGLSSKGSLSKENKRLLRLLQECRQRNLFIFLVLPSFFLLEKYAGIFRSTSLFNVLSSKKNYKLRYYKVYNYNQKKRLYILGKSLMDYSKPYIQEKHRFFKKLPPTIDEEAYRKKKLDAFNDVNEEKLSASQEKYILQRDALIKFCLTEFGVTQNRLSEVISSSAHPLDRSQISRIAQKPV